MVNILKGRNIDLYHQFLRTAAGHGVDLAHEYLGRILSPLSDVEWKGKDAKDAIAYLEQAVSGEVSQDALYELAKLLNVGCERVAADRRRVQKMYDHAHRLAQAAGRNLPPLPAPDDNAATGGEIGGSGAILQFAAPALVVAGFFMARRRAL
jgi:hypothetical protein